MTKYLFDSDNYKLLGKGVDSKGNKKKDGFLFDWKWEGNRKGQTSFAKAGEFKLEALYWYTDYEGTVRYYRRNLISERGFKNRIEAQHCAERTLEKLLRKHTDIINKVKKQ